MVKIFRPITVKDADGNVTGYTEKTYATYTYDAWGKLIGITNSAGTSIINKQTTSTSLANLNPLRYRGYYYDNETGFYYLQSRYYDPANRRFISADIYASTDSKDAIACNMFAYCGNNPVIYLDENGEFFGLAICIGIGICALIGGVESYASAKTSGASTEEALIQGGIGFFSSGLTAAVASIPGIGLPTAMAVSGGIGFVSSTASEVVHYAYNKDNPDYEFDLLESGANVLFGTASNALSGGLSTGVNLVTTGDAVQAFVGSVASAGFSSVYFATKKLVAEIF